MSIRPKLRRRIPFLVFLFCAFTGILWGFVQGNLTAGVLTGLGTGLVVLVLLRFILYRKKNSLQEAAPASTSD